MARTQGYVKNFNHIPKSIPWVIRPDQLFWVDKTVALIQTPGYSCCSAVHDDDFTTTDASTGNFFADDLDGFNMSVKDGVQTFTPTAAVLSNFEDFLQKVENISGREVGVVKVILPKEL